MMMHPKGFEVKFLNCSGKPVKIISIMAVTSDMAFLKAEKLLPLAIAMTYDRASVRPI